MRLIKTAKNSRGDIREAAYWDQFDSVLWEKYKDVVTNTLNMIYNTQEANTKYPNTLAMETGSTDKKTGKSYSKWSYSHEKTYQWWKDSYNKQNSFISTNPKTSWQDDEKRASVQENANAREQLSQKLAGLGVKFKRTNTIKLTNPTIGASKKQPKNDIQKFYINILQKELLKAESEKLENSNKSDTLKGTNAPKANKAWYKSRKWRVVPLKVPKVAKAKTSKYKW